MTQRFCGECGAPVAPAARFCASCGRAVRPAGDAAPAPAPSPAAPPVAARPTPPRPAPAQPVATQATAAPAGRSPATAWWFAAAAVAALLGFVAVALVAGRGGDDGPVAAGTTTTVSASTTTTTLPAGPTEPGWTVLIYMLADNDLEPFALTDLAEIASVPSSDDLEILVLVDRGQYDARPVPGVGSFTSTKLLRSEGGAMVELADWGERNTGDPDTLAEFVEAGLARAPNRRTALIIWDHGGGWTGIGPDESHGDVLEIGQIRQALDRAVIAAGHRPLDLLGFDACLMATLEVAATMAPVADHMLASAELEPGHGWDYRALDILTVGDVDPESFGRHLAESYQVYADGFGTGYDITISLVDLRAVDRLEVALATLTDGLAADMAAVAPTLGVLRPVALSYGRSPNPEFDSHLVDLGDVLEELAAASPSSAAVVAEATAALADAVLVNVNGPATRRASGLSIYFPPYRDYFRLDYALIDPLPAWSRFLDAYYGAGDAIPLQAQARFVRSGEPSEEPGDFDGIGGIGAPSDDVDLFHFFDEDGINVVAQVEPGAAANIADVTIFYGLTAGDGVVFLGEEPGVAFDDGSGLVAAIYDLTILQISDLFDTVNAYIALTWDDESGVATFDIPMRYLGFGDGDSFGDGDGDAVGREIILRLVVDDTGRVLAETYYVVNPNGSYGELSASTGIIVPTALKEWTDGSTTWIPTSDIGLFADLPELQYAFVPIESGTELEIRLRIRDFGGNEDWAGLRVVVP